MVAHAQVKHIGVTNIFSVPRSVPSQLSLDLVDKEREKQKHGTGTSLQRRVDACNRNNGAQAYKHVRLARVRLARVRLARVRLARV
jgi:hypothetical protein